MRRELSSLEEYNDAWARYALTLEERSVPPPSSAPNAGGGLRPHVLPSAPRSGAQAQAEHTAEQLIASIAADLQHSLGAAAWHWHDERVGEMAAVPLSWLAQVQAGVSLLQAAAQREPDLRMKLAEQQVRADAAEEALALCQADIQSDTEVEHGKVSEVDPSLDGYEPYGAGDSEALALWRARETTR